MSDETEHKMNPQGFETYIDPAIEARIVALILGEASDFETDELENLMVEQPEVRAFYKRMVATHALLARSERPEAAAAAGWKMSESRRAAVVERIRSGDVAEKSEAAVVARTSDRRRMLKVLIPFAIAAALAALMMPALFVMKDEQAAMAVAPREDATVRARWSDADAEVSHWSYADPAVPKSQSGKKSSVDLEGKSDGGANLYFEKGKKIVNGGEIAFPVTPAKPTNFETRTLPQIEIVRESVHPKEYDLPEERVDWKVPKLADSRPSFPNQPGSSIESEVSRREAVMPEARESLAAGLRLAEEKDFESAAAAYRAVVDRLVPAPMTQGLRDKALDLYGETAAKIAHESALEGNFDKARQTAKEILEVAPEHKQAKRVLERLDDPEWYNRATTPGHVANVKEVERLLNTGREYSELGDFNNAELQYEGVLKTDRTNTAALRGLEELESANDDYTSASRDQTRARMLREVDEAWETVPNAPVQGIRGGSEAIQTANIDGLLQEAAAGKPTATGEPIEAQEKESILARGEEGGRVNMAFGTIVAPGVGGTSTSSVDYWKTSNQENSVEMKLAQGEAFLQDSIGNPVVTKLAEVDETWDSAVPQEPVELMKRQSEQVEVTGKPSADLNKDFAENGEVTPAPVTGVADVPAQKEMQEAVAESEKLGRLNRDFAKKFPNVDSKLAAGIEFGELGELKDAKPDEKKMEESNPAGVNFGAGGIDSGGMGNGVEAPKADAVFRWASQPGAVTSFKSDVVQSDEFTMSAEGRYTNWTDRDSLGIDLSAVPEVVDFEGFVDSRRSGESRDKVGGFIGRSSGQPATTSLSSSLAPENKGVSGAWFGMYAARGDGAKKENVAVPSSGPVAAGEDESRWGNAIAGKAMETTTSEALSLDLADSVSGKNVFFDVEVPEMLADDGSGFGNSEELGEAVEDQRFRLEAKRLKVLDLMERETAIENEKNESNIIDERRRSVSLVEAKREYEREEEMLNELQEIHAREMVSKTMPSNPVIVHERATSGQKVSKLKALSRFFLSQAAEESVQPDAWFEDFGVDGDSVNEDLFSVHGRYAADKAIGIVIDRIRKETEGLEKDLSIVIAEPVPGRPGQVYSPFSTGSPIDVSGFPGGTVMRCPYTSKKFKVPSSLKPIPSPAARDTASPETETLAEPFSTFSLHVSDVSFKLAQAALLEKGEWPEAAKIREEEFVNAFDYGDAPAAMSEKVACQMEQSAHPFLAERNLLRVSMRTAAMGRDASQPLRLTVLLDLSGSMERADRGESVSRAMMALAGHLSQQDTVTLIGFAREPRLLADRYSGDRAGDLVKLVTAAPSEGGTNLEEALKLADEVAKRQYDAAGQNRIVLLTDGAANLGDAQPESLSRRIVALRQAGIAFDACGVGADGLNDAVLEALTRDGDGRYYFINRPEDADEGFVKQLAGALRPAAKNVKVQVKFNPERVPRYRLLGFEKHILKTEDFRNDAVDAAEMASAEAGVAVYQYQVNAEGSGDVGEVFVRFQDMATGEMVERSWAIPFERNAKGFDEAAPALRLAGCASFLAEKLRGGPEAGNIELEELIPVAREVRGSFEGNERVKQLIEMMERARSLESAK